MPTVETTNKEIVMRKWYQQLWDEWNLSVADELFTPDYRLHLPGNAAPFDRESTKHVVGMFGKAFPDLRHTVDEIVSEGATVAARWTVNGTHRGDFQGIPPTNKPVRLSGTTVHHFADGRISETWLAFDSMELLRQLGASPQP